MENLRQAANVVSSVFYLNQTVDLLEAARRLRMLAYALRGMTPEQFPQVRAWLRNVSKRLFLATALIACALCAILLFHFSHNFHTQPVPQSTAQRAPLQQMDVGLPVRLKIPKIGVDAAVEYVGLTPDGSMGVPDKLADVAWFKLGPRPGQQGSAVIAGHRSSKKWIPGVFDNLHELQPGDCVYVQDEKGSTFSFVVRESRTYDPEADAGDVFSKNDGIHLNLVTCDGTWNTAQKSFSKRLVIFTDAVP